LSEITTSTSLINDIASTFKFNSKQRIAFGIAAKCFIESHIAKQVDKSYVTKILLCLLLTGPGGTEKTHVVKGLKAVMTAYGCEHKIYFLAPTGSTAALIDGMTIHKGLGIKIKSKEKGKGNCALDDDKEDYLILISIQNHAALRWRGPGDSRRTSETQRAAGGKSPEQQWMARHKNYKQE
jgi:hypothetical protein